MTKPEDFCYICGEYLYVSYDDSHDEVYETCPKCEYRDLPKNIRMMCPEFRTEEFCEHFNWKEHCKECDTWNPAYNPEGKTGWHD